MGKKIGNSWLNAVKKAFRSPSSDDEKRRRRREENENEQEEEEEKKRGKKRWIFGKNSPLETTIQHNAASKSVNSHAGINSNVKKTIRDGNHSATKESRTEKNSVCEQRHTIAMAMATAAAAEAAVATARAAVEIARLNRTPRLVMELKAAIVIQTFFRGYLARRALLALRGVVKLQALIRGHNVRKRAKTTLQCIQSLVRVQAHVCDQRRRLSCEAMSLGSMLGYDNNGKKSISENWSNASCNLDGEALSLEEIQALIQRAKECSLKQGKTLAHALSQKMRRSEDDRFSINSYEDLEEERRSCSSKKMVHPWDRKDDNLCNISPIKTLEIDTSRPYSFTPPKYTYKPRCHEKQLDSYSSPFQHKHHILSPHSPKTPSSSKIKPVQVRSWSPCYNRMEERLNYQISEGPNAINPIHMRRMSMSENPCPSPRPNYMGPTASAIARIRSQSTPRPGPSRAQTGSAKKRLLFGNEVRENVPYYYTE